MDLGVWLTDARGLVLNISITCLLAAELVVLLSHTPFITDYILYYYYRFLTT